MDRTLLRDGSSQLGITLSDFQLDQFEAFEAALYEANQIMNLTRVSQADCVVRHFLDSLILSPVLESGIRVLDIGSGPGFPAWPLACARPDIHVTSVDSSNKFTRFLEGQALSNMEVVLARAEEFLTEEPFDIVVGRALAPLTLQLELSARPAKVKGLVIPMRSSQEVFVAGTQAEYQLKLKLEKVDQVVVPGSDVVRQLPHYRKVAPTPKKFPRRWPDMKAEPL